MFNRFKYIFLYKAFFYFFISINLVGYSQNDTIYLADTIISSVRIINKDNNQLNYFYLDSTSKITSSIPVEKVQRIVYEDEKIEVFCDLISKKKFLSTEETIMVNYGTRDSLWIDKKIYTLINKDLKRYNSIIDALNYMGSEGWKTINTYSSSQNSYTIEHYILKKEIKK
tara:strand:- start:158 stop:667 length:510 start_codon:yes stop_codon:yes gene_type:complete